MTLARVPLAHVKQQVVCKHAQSNKSKALLKLGTKKTNERCDIAMSYVLHSFEYYYFESSLWAMTLLLVEIRQILK